MTRYEFSMATIYMTFVVLFAALAKTHITGVGQGTLDVVLCIALVITTILGYVGCRVAR